ncbi:hypothetical protein PR202_ga02620 [Eleusine coracana subsp. coracana]|uniref:Aluminum-activated malate transporter n=1 Tax=Eleusine coracana subsp. coracana TaxID=191504 RepID=A0AAV5BLB9_ELECO|nr:hypothetical protein PR202_ga02620 [Eleusine coracana subsp. coracana]
MGSLPVSLPPLLGSLRSSATMDQRGVHDSLMPLSFDWGVPAGGQEEVWGQAAAEGKGCGERLWGAVRAAAAEMWAFARKDPRKPVFAAKVATALAFTTLLVFLREPSDIASHSIWAILTVVVVFEFSIGATLSKGMNRGLGTVTAGGLALAVAELATQMGKYNMVFLIISIFIVAFGATLTKLHPKMKPYEYGLRVFLLTFCIVTVSGYKAGKFTSMAISRFVLIAVGAAISLSLGFAIWEPPHGPYKMMKYPWRSYTKVSGALRHCSFAVMALHGCILSEIQAPAESRKVFSAELHRVGQEGAKVLRELGNKVKTMTKLSSSSILAEVHLATEELQKKIDEKSYLLVNKDRWEARRQHEETEQTADAADAADNENRDGGTTTPFSILEQRTTQTASLRTLSSADYIQDQCASALSLATFASLLIEFVARLQNLVDAFEELSEKANFKDPVEEPAAINRETYWVFRICKLLLLNR